MTVRFDALFSRFLGATAVQLRTIFAEMPRRPGVYLFDEFDSVARMSQLIGDKLIAILPVLGWWEQRKALKFQEVKFSLVVSVFGPGVYAAIKPRVEVEPAITIGV